jgi:hypothetical protein
MTTKVGRKGKSNVLAHGDGPRAKRSRKDSILPTKPTTWDRIEDLYLKLLDEYYENEDVRRAKPIAAELTRHLRKADPKRDSIFASECQSLVCEVRGDLPAAIRHRLIEIEKIGILWQSSRDDDQRDMFFNLYAPTDLADRHDLLAILYHDSGQLKKAIQALWKSREICEEHGVKFDSTDLLKEYLQELRGPIKAKKKK